ncbi:MAG: hypothetical protein R2852_08470 [Bacteroidia bacterium]
MIHSKEVFFYLRIGVFFLFIFMGIYGLCFHEFWRDEVRALSIAIQAESVFDLTHLLKNEGHPTLWYALLNVFYKMTGSTSVLPILSIVFASGIMYLLLFKSPFPLLISICIGFGFWGLYSNGINCRNYGIGAFLLLLFTHIRKSQPNKIYLQTLFLVLAMQTNMYMAMMSAFMGIIVFTDFSNTQIRNKSIFALTLLGVSFLFAFYTTLPDSQSTVVSEMDISHSRISKIWDVGYGFNGFIYNWFPYKHGFLTWILGLSLLPFIRVKKTLFVLIFSMVFMTFFSLCVRDNYLHHQGMWLFFLLSLLWLHYKQIIDVLKSKTYFRYLYGIGCLAILFILINNFHRGMKLYFDDITQSKSDSKNFATWLHQNSSENEIWIAEPDYIMEPVMYYWQHPFYIVREKKFNTYVHFTKANDYLLDLSRILEVSDSFHSSGKSTLIILEHKVNPNDSFYKYSMKRFNLDSTAIKKLSNNYTLLDSFIDNYYTDEHYYVYRKKS